MHENETLSVKTARNVIWNISGFLFSVIITFFSVPIFVSLLGEDNYGLYVLFQSIMSGIYIMRFGVSPATVKYVSENIGREDYRGANKFINTTLCFNLLIGIVGAIMIILLSGPMSQKIFKIPIESQLIAKECFYWVAFGWIISQIVETLSGIPLAFQNFKLVAIGRSLLFGLITILGLIVLYVGGSLINLMQVNVIGLIISAFVWWLLNKIKFSKLKIRVRFEWEIFKKTISYGLWQTLAGLGGMLYHKVDKIIIGIFLSPAAIGYYNLPVMICSRAYEGLYKSGTVFFPLISYLQGKDDRERIYRYFINGSWIIGVLSTICFVPLILFGKAFLKLWISQKFANESGQLFLYEAIFWRV
ncbi:MAG: oligosaccharide flippase family protein [Promethearchaeota archaeon]